MTELKLVIPRTPPSVNNMAVGAQRSWGRYYRVKTSWEQEIGWLLRAEIGWRLREVGNGVKKVEATATLRFPKKNRRDAGNYGAILEKAVGDILQEVGVIPDDTPDYYRWTSVTFDPERGSNQTTLYLTLHAP